MNNINEVITKLYETLVTVRYPGIAQIDISNVESTVAENNRIPMLHWLATQSLGVVDPNSNPPTADETSIVQWYTELGICTNREALLGECSLKEQLDTLNRLTHFIINVFNADERHSLDSAWSCSKRYCDNEVNVVSLSHNMTVNMKYKAVEDYMRSVENSVKDIQNNLNIQDMTDNVKAEKTENTNNINNIELKKESVLEEFYESFQSIEMNHTDGKQCKNTNFLDKYMETVPQQFSIVKEVLDTEANISETIISQGPLLKESALNEVVQDVVVEIETLVKVYNPDLNSIK